MIQRITLIGYLFLCILGGLFAAEGTATRRLGLFIGSNNGGRDRVMLRYAVSDAKSVSRVFSGMGGISDEDNILLVEPSVREINRQIDNLGRVLSQSRQNAQRTELVFYYSGHSDENGLVLNREHYAYQALRDRINTVPADMRIVILDSCSSGAITRAKGGVKTQPFLFDSSVSATGYAFLTSSSADEVSQESDAIESSYFTHSILAGLRGAADSVGDGRVTLNELYRFAYAETLARTETSLYGAQHPSYDIQISGSGDVVLTDIKETSASLLFSEDLTGRISIRDSSDFLVAELSKINNKPLELGLEPGLYRITLQQGNNFYRAEITLPENVRTTLNMGNFQMIAAAAVGNRNRGDGLESGSDSNDVIPYYPFGLQFIPMGFEWEKANNNILIGILAARGHNINGVGAAWMGLINTGDVNGVQGSGVFNFTGGNVRGVQGTGIVNIAGGNVRGVQGAGIGNVTQGNIQGVQGSGIGNITMGDIRGVQGSGIFNFTWGDVQGVQGAGIINYAGEIHGLQGGLVNVNMGGKGVMFGLVNISNSEDIVPIGLVNIMKNGILRPAVFIDDMLFTNLSLRSGTKNFYAIITTGVGEFFYNAAENLYIANRVGFGYEHRINKFFMNIDITTGNISHVGYNISDNRNININQLRLSGGYQILKHLGIFGGISYDLLYWENLKGTPDPKEFGGLMIGGTTNHFAHKLGLFGGIQF